MVTSFSTVRFPDDAPHGEITVRVLKNSTGISEGEQ
jgi:hypothetical protein